MRPPGEIRMVLVKALGEQPGTVRDLATRTQVGFAAAARTVENMVRAGQAMPFDTTRVPGVCRPVTIYSLSDSRDPAPRAPQPQVELATCWADWPGTTA